MAKYCANKICRYNNNDIPPHRKYIAFIFTMPHALLFNPISPLFCSVSQIAVTLRNVHTNWLDRIDCTNQKQLRTNNLIFLSKKMSTE